MWSAQRLFGGRLLEVARAGDAAGRLGSDPAAGRSLDLTIVFPAGEPYVSEPLLTTGEAGRGDSLYVHYVDGVTVRFGFDHWVTGGSVSRPVPVDFAVVHHVVLSWGALLPSDDPARKRLRLALGGQVVLDAPVTYFPARPEQVALGTNPIGMSTSRPAFTGELMGVGSTAGPANEGGAAAFHLTSP